MIFSRLVIVLAITGISPALAQVDWTWRQPNPAGYWYNTVAYGEGIFVAAGDGIAVSNDGLAWESIGTFAHDPGETTTFTAAAYGGGEFVAISQDGKTVKSGNGRDWIKGPVIRQLNQAGITDLVYGKGNWYATGLGGHLYKSTDGLSFQVIAGVSAYSMEGIGFGNQTFVAMGIDRRIINGVTTDRAVAFSSSDGETWVSFEGPAEWIRANPSNPVWDGVKWVVAFYSSGGGNFWSSVNGVQWSSINPTYDGHFVASVLATGEGLIAGLSDASQPFGYSETGGVGWQAIFGPQRGGPGSGVHYGWSFKDLTYSPDFDKWVAVGACGGIAVGAHPSVFHLVDEAEGAGYGRCVTSVTRGQGAFFACDPDTIFRSFDGMAWSRIHELREGVPATDRVPNLLGIAAGEGGLLCFGLAGAILSSGDGTAWKKETNWFLQPNERPPGDTIRAAAYGQGRWVVVGDDGFVAATTTDRTLWVERLSNVTNTLYKIVYTGTKFVAVGSNGTIVNADTVTSWQSRSPFTNSSEDLTAVAAGGTIAKPILVAAGGQALATSHDHGDNWTIHPVPLPAMNFRALVWTGTEFIATGYGGVVMASPDGINWAIRATAAKFVSGKELAYNGSIYVLADNGLLSAPERTIGQTFKLGVTVQGTGAVSVYPDLPEYEPGTPMLLRADPWETFAGWSGGISSFNEKLSFEMTRNYTLVATFAGGEDLNGIVISGPIQLTTPEPWPWHLEQIPGPSGPTQAVAVTGYPVFPAEPSSIDATLVGPGQLSFQWSVSTTSPGGFLAFLLDGAQTRMITGEQDWRSETVSIPAGNHPIKWSFRRSASDGVSLNEGYLANVKWTPTVTSLTFEDWAAGFPLDRRGLLTRNGPRNLPNLVSYVLGLSPGEVSGQPNLPFLKPQEPGTNFVTFRYTRRKNLAGYSAEVVFQDSNDQWKILNPLLPRTVVASTSNTETVEVIIPTASRKLILALQAKKL